MLLTLGRVGALLLCVLQPTSSAPASPASMASSPTLPASSLPCDCLPDTDTEEYYYHELTSASSSSCCEACTADPQCQSITFTDSRCYLKNATTLTTKKKLGVAVCGVRTPLPPSPPTPSPRPPTPMKYVVTLTEHSPLPVVSPVNDVGRGRSPDGCLAFNPSFIPANPPFLNTSGCLLRLCCGTTCAGHGQASSSPPAASLSSSSSKQDRSGEAVPAERIGFAPCDVQTGVCDDVVADFNLDPNGDSEDPRAFLYNGLYYNFYYHDGSPGNCSGTQCTVKLARTATPLVASSWEHIQTYPWHRNGCCYMNPVGAKSFCIWGEGPSPFPGLGISYTTDLDAGVFTQVPWSVDSVGALNEDEMYLLPWGADLNEVKLEAGTHIMRLSTGDFLHFYAAATPGWVPDGNYTAGYIIMDKDDPTRIIQRSVAHIMIPTFEYETLCGGASECPFPGERKNVIFLCSATPLGNDKYRLFFGAGDGNTGTGVVSVALAQS